MGGFLGANIFHFQNSPTNCCIKIVLPLESQQEAMPLGGSLFPHQMEASIRQRRENKVPWLYIWAKPSPIKASRPRH